MSSSPLADALAQQCAAAPTAAPTITTTTSSRVDAPKDEPATPDKGEVPPPKDEPATPDKGDVSKDGKTALLVIDVQDCFVEVHTKIQTCLSRIIISQDIEAQIQCMFETEMQGGTLAVEGGNAIVDNINK